MPTTDTLLRVVLLLVAIVLAGVIVAALLAMCQPTTITLY